MQKYIHGKQRRREDHLFLSSRRGKNLYVSALSGLKLGDVVAIHVDPAKGIITLTRQCGDCKDLQDLYRPFYESMVRKISKQGQRGMTIRCNGTCKEMPDGRYVRIMKWKSIKHYQHETMLPDVQESGKQE